jgi:hypothetical protein
VCAGAFNNIERLPWIDFRPATLASTPAVATIAVPFITRPPIPAEPPPAIGSRSRDNAPPPRTSWRDVKVITGAGRSAATADRNAARAR